MNCHVGLNANKMFIEDLLAISLQAKGNKGKKNLQIHEKALPSLFRITPTATKCLVQSLEKLWL